jgi:hypothetical protein
MDLPDMKGGFPDKKIGGGSDKFISFIKKELIPKIEKEYNTSPYRIIMGHSLGGLFAVDAFVNHTDLFTSYASIDPSMWWNSEKYLKNVKQKLSKADFNDKNFYLGIANNSEGINMKNIPGDKSPNTRMIRSELEFDKDLGKVKDKGFRYRRKYYSDDTHNSVALPAYYDAIRFFFDFYPMILSTKDLTTNSDKYLADKYRNHFDMISKRMGYTVIPSPDELLNLSKNFEKRGLTKTSHSLLKLASEF